MVKFDYSGLENHIRQQGKKYLADHGFSSEEARKLLTDAESLGMEQTALEHFHARYFENPDGSLDLDKQKAFARVNAIQRTVATYRPVLERRALADNQTETDIKAAVQNMKESGFTLDETTDFFNRYVKDARAMTPHPTEGLSPEGVKLSLDLMRAAETYTSRQRTHALKSAIDAMFAAETFAAVKKATILEEIDQDTLYSKIHLAGANKLDRLIEQAIHDAYDEDTIISTNTAPRTWAYDADGKPNADGFGMLAKMATSTMESFRLLESQLDEALEDGSLSGAHRRSVKALRKNIRKLARTLEPVYKQSRHIVQKLALADPAEREAVYRAFYRGRASKKLKSFKELSRDFAKLYQAVDSRNGGLDFFHKTKTRLDEIRHALPDITALDEAFRNVVRTGFVLEKGQTRHNDLMYKDIINNLFHYIARQDDLPGWIAQALTPEETTKLREHPDKPWDRMIRSRRQAGIWEDLIHSMKEGNTALHKKRRKQLQKLLYASNPLTFRSDGYPEQTYSLLDRLKLRSVYPLKFEEGIISDSQNLAPFRQRFLAEAFGMHAMKHMPLFEDLLNFGISQTLMSRFGRHGGAEAAEEKATLLTSLGVGTGYKGLHVIVPASDSGKEGGPGARLKALRQYRKLIRKAIQTHTPIQIMLGGGLSLGRFGGDVGIVRRIIAQELKAHGVKRGRDYDWHNPEDAAMLRMISAVLYTEQGRANRLLSATPGQICDTIAGRIVESAEDLLDLTGAAEIIDPPAKLTLLQERMLDTLADRSLATFNILRHVKDENGTRILDTLAEGIRPALSMPFANNGARPASKSGNKGITEERAIGNDQSLHAAQTFHGGFYGLGQVMAQLKEENADDLSHLLRNNPDVEYGNIISGLTDALRFNAQTLFAKASPDKDWNFDKALRLGHETDIVDGSLVCHDPAASKEEAYLAKIYYDRVLFFAVLEGAATGKLDQPLDKLIKTIRPKNGQLDVYPGPATLARWPDALDIAVEHDKNGPGYALIWGMEKALKNGQDIPEDHKRAIMGSWRAGTASHSAIWAANAQQGITPYVSRRRSLRVPKPATKPDCQHHPDCTAG